LEQSPSVGGLRFAAGNLKRSNMRNIVLVAVAATLLGFATAAVSAGRADQKFIEDAIQGNLAEVQMGQLAQQKGQSDEVKSYGEMLVTDHQANNEKAKQVANEIGVSPPNEPSAKPTTTSWRSVGNRVRSRVRKNDGRRPQERRAEV
jgi:predicted outer membrane protein